MKIHLAQINPTIGDLEKNTNKILDEFKLATEKNCDLAIFPEMAICGYICEDLLQKKYFLDAIKEQIVRICQATLSSKCAVLVGCPTIDFSRIKKGVLYNSAILIENGEIKRIINKKTLPNYGVFDENRYFTTSNSLSYFEFRGLTLAILVCEDLWDPKNLFLLQEQIFDFVISINASPYSQKKQQYRHDLANNFCKTLNKSLIYLNQVGGQDSVVFDGSSFVMNCDGEFVLQMKSFEEDSAIIEITKNKKLLPLTKKPELENHIARNYSACVLALRDYVKKSGFSQVIIGMSGGIDSAIVATIAVDALGSDNVKLYALPSKYNSENSMIDAVECAKNLDVALQVISIEDSFNTMLNIIGKISDLAKENLQPRIRGNILMAISNTNNALLLSTGNKSELACGYATLYGDMCGAFNPIKDLYKTEVYELAKWRNQNISPISLHKKINLIPQNILIKAPTAELRENQKDSDSLPEYEILDKILFEIIEKENSVSDIVKLGFEENLVKKVANLFYNSEYKRRQSCIGVKISAMSFDKERRYPITNKFKH